MTDDGEATIQVEKDRWEDPEIWGNLLADVVRTLAETYPKKEKLALKKIMRELRDDMKRGPADRE